METRQLGKSDLLITPMGIGAWAMGGGGWTWSWGPQNDNDSVTAIHEALDRGINWIDTAAVYGLGHSEEVVKQALYGRNHRPYIFTKCERTWDKNGKISGTLKAASIRRECEDSLRRLGVEVIDLYQIHWPEPDADNEEGWTEMARLKDEGKVRHIGVSNFIDGDSKKADGGRHDGIQKLTVSKFNLLSPYNDDATRASATKTTQVKVEHRNFGAFKVPSLRNVGYTGPYMHSGELLSLDAVVRHYSELNVDRLHTKGESLLKPLKLTQRESADLVAFLQTLNMDRAPPWRGKEYAIPACALSAPAAADSHYAP